MCVWDSKVTPIHMSLHPIYKQEYYTPNDLMEEIAFFFHSFTLSIFFSLLSIFSFISFLHIYSLRQVRRENS